MVPTRFPWQSGAIDTAFMFLFSKCLFPNKHYISRHVGEAVTSQMTVVPGGMSACDERTVASC